MPTSTAVRNQVPENRTLTQAVAILRTIKADRSARGLRLTEIARKCGLEKSTVHRLLATLAAEGLVDQDPESDRYRLGLTLLELGMAVDQRLDIRSEALPVLRQLSERAADTVHLGVPRGAHVVYLEKVERRHAVQLRSRVGERMPLHSTGIGEAILAFAGDADVAKALEAGVEQRTVNQSSGGSMIDARRIARTRTSADLHV